MGNVVALDQVPKQDGLKIFLVGLDPQVAVEAGHLGKAAGLPVFLEGLLDEEPLLRRQSALARDSFVVQKLPEREGKHLPRQRPSAHLCRDLLRKHLGRRTGQIYLAFFRAHQAVDEGLPTGSGLNLVEEAVDRLGVLLLRVERVVGLGDQAEVVLAQVVEAVVEKVQVQNVLPRNPAVHQPLDDLEHVGRLAASAHPDADGGLAVNRLDAQAPGHPGLQPGFLEVQDDGFDRLYHRVTPGKDNCRYLSNPVINIAGLS